jgi:hypothetical protein
MTAERNSGSNIQQIYAEMFFYIYILNIDINIHKPKFDKAVLCLYIDVKAAWPVVRH